MPSRVASPDSRSALPPLAVCSTALWACFSLAPLTPSGFDWKLALAGVSAHLAQGVTDDLGMRLLMALPLGFLWQGAFWPRNTAARLAAGTGVLAGWLAWVSALSDLGRCAVACPEGASGGGE
jgi:hypothetical protein